MKPWLEWVLMLVLTLAWSGCQTQSTAPARQQAAFIAGQLQGAKAASLTTDPHQPKPVLVVGDVQNRSVPWSEELTVARAIVQAIYLGRNDPRVVVVHRGEAMFVIDARRLMSGFDDRPLDPGDVVELRP